MLSSKCDTKTATRFLRKFLNASHTIEPRVITVDKNAAYRPAIDALKGDEALPETIAQDHRFIKRHVNLGIGIDSFNTVRRTLKGYEAMHMIRERQIKDAEKEM